MGDPQLQSVRHDYIRYANVWEDAAVLLKGLDAKPGGKHLSIGSAGDNALALLSTDPEGVVAVDINAVQLRLCRFKKTAIGLLPRESYLDLVGFTNNGNRQNLFEKVVAHLDDDDQRFWKAHKDWIDKGLIHAGKFERYFKIFSRYVLPFIHSKKLVNQLLTPKSASEQSAFYQHHWNTWRWRLLFKFFFSKYVMGKAGRDPAFLKQVEIPVSEYIFEKAARHLCTPLATENHILQYNLTGQFGTKWPDYVQPGIYEKIQGNIGRLDLHFGLAESAFDAYGKFDYFNLSNIFEYMDLPTFKGVAESLAKGANTGATFAYWNLMAPRNMASILPNRYKDNPTLREELTAIDRGFFYNYFIINYLCEEN